MSDGRRRFRAGVAIAALTPLLATGATVLGLVDAPIWALVAVTSLGGALIAGSGGYSAWVQDRAETSERERELGSLLRTGLPVPTVSRVDPYGHLSVFRSTLAVRIGGERPEYVPRDNDNELRDLFARSDIGMVVVRG